MKLYSYFRSSASYRVRIALNLKGLKADIIPVNLLKGEQQSAGYGQVNPQHLLPALIDGEHTLTQSLAIMEYLEEIHPMPPLLPQSPPQRARVRALSLTVACEIAPLNNVGILRYLTGTLGASEEQKNQWYDHWITRGFTALEQMLVQGGSGTYCHGSQPSMADCCLVPQIFNARRFNVDLSPYPTIARIAENCEKHPAFISAHPSRQPDAA
jgi:maleylpyruvate isomerase